MSLEHYTIFAKEIFKKCKKDKGTIYLIEFEHYNEWHEKWKYGKTKNLEKRLTFYPKNIKLLYSKEVDFLSTRECWLSYSSYLKHRWREHTEYCIYNPINEIKDACESNVELTDRGIEFRGHSDMFGGYFSLLTMLEKMTFKTR
jgi:hypothetical protein